MKKRSSFIHSLQYILKSHLNSDEKLRTVSIIVNTELKKESDHKSSGEIPVVFSKASAQASRIKSPELFDQLLTKPQQEPHSANREINKTPVKPVYLNTTDTYNQLSDLPWKWEPQFRTILSVREKEIVEILAQGCNHKMIADRLGISINTVRNHFRRIHFKLAVHSNTQVLLKVFNTGISKTSFYLFLYYSAASSVCV